MNQAAAAAAAAAALICHSNILSVNPAYGK
jgi:hypothetical protein